MSASRGTRSRSRASTANYAPSTRQVPSPYVEPPSADLPGLYPVHDGSYGVNTHINLDSVRRRGKKPKAGFVNEDDEDRRFARRLKGRNGTRFAMENDLQKVVEETVQEAEKEDQVNEESSDQEDASDLIDPNASFQPESQREESQEDDDYIDELPINSPPSDHKPKVQEPEKQEPATAKQGQPRYRKPRQQRNPEAEKQPSIVNGGGDDGHGIQSGNSGLRFEPDSYIPELGTYFTDERGNQGMRPSADVHFRPSEPHRLVHNRQPSAPPTTQTSHFPTTTGHGSFNYAAFRPSSSKSFNGETLLYGNATLQTPHTRADSAPAPRSSPGFGSTTPDKPGNSVPKGLSPDEWEVVNNLIHDMRGPPEQESSLSANATIPSLKHLTPTEIQATRALVADMGKDPATSIRVLDELDKAAQKVGPPKSGTIRLFGEGTHNQTYKPENISDSLKPTGDGFAEQNGFGTGGLNSGATDVDKDQPQYPHLPSEDLDIDLPHDADADDEEEEYDEENEAEYEEALRRAASRPHTIHERPTSKVTNGPGKALPINQQILQIPTRRRRSWFTWLLRTWDTWKNTAIVFLTILLGAWIFLTFIGSHPMSGSDDVFNNSGVQWPDWTMVKDNIVQAIPTGINIPVPTFSLGNLKGFGTGKSDNAQSKLIDSIAPKIPPKVFVDVDKNGKLKISQDFWHALRDLIREDDIILSLETAKNEAPDVSDAHWLAIKSRLGKDASSLRPSPTGASESGPPPPDVTSTDKSKGSHNVLDSFSNSKYWERWLGRNNDALKKENDCGVAMPREEFVKLIKKETEVYQQDIRKELLAQDVRIKELIIDIIKLRDSFKDSHGLTRQEVQTICDAAVRKAITNAKLDAMASGRIRGHANDMFTNQVNFFGIGSGAVLDPKLTSKPWQVPSGYYKFRSKKWYERDGWRPLPPTAALTPWTEDAECFCAGPSALGQTEEVNSVAIMTSRHIIPQHLVVEHILPGSTLDAGAMPRDIEVWAYIEEVTLRDEVRAFSASNFLGTGPGKSLNEGFVKVGHFVYESKTHGDGVQIFKLSDELTHMRVYSNHIVIRAVSNYGADHTCFYRLRMYGDIVETQPWREWE
ncbi:hypothetical protein F4804DRAFT_334892 [Jackrogersella minutella]|nr:hypothetical protein F4804DRAFT_334892 [Jackrogersella minutella]